MCAYLSCCLLLLFFSAERPTSGETERKPHPLFPSLHELSDEEESKLDDIIDRFIDYDSGKLKGPEGKKALTEFQKLGPDAIPALLRGLNKAAKIEHSCPAVQITKKLSRMVSASKDPELLEFIRENAGAGLERSRHLGIIKDLRVQCMLRRRTVIDSGLAVARAEPALKGTSTPAVDPWKKTVQKMTISELVEAAGSERGTRLKTVLLEMGDRRGDMIIGGLGSAAASYEGEIQQLARDLLGRQLARLKTDALKEKLKDDRAEVRAVAAQVAASKGHPLQSELIGLLADEEKQVWQAAHEALVKLAKGPDFGPKPNATPTERKEAAEKWRDWLDRQSGR